jgi:hypothetical protein
MRRERTRTVQPRISKARAVLGESHSERVRYLLKKLRRSSMALKKVVHELVRLQAMRGTDRGKVAVILLVCAASERLWC